MRTATVADLRNNFATISAWIENGESVEIRKRGRVFAELNPPKPKKPFNGKEYWKNRMEVLNKIWGDRVFSSKEFEEIRDYNDRSKTLFS